MKYLFVLLAIVIYSNLFAQVSKGPSEVTPAIAKQLQNEVEKELNGLKLQLQKEDANAVDIEFALDTFRIEAFQRKYSSYNYSTIGMVTSCYDAAKKYDGLLNKYYKKLLNILEPVDRKILVKAQKAWLNFKKEEELLIETMSKEQYSGGGSVQQLNDSLSYLELIKKRVFEIIGHIGRTQTY